jgi:hypothetical protein
MRDAELDAGTVHEVTLPGYCIDKTGRSVRP